jgi:hypothetical protein
VHSDNTYLIFKFRTSVAYTYTFEFGFYGADTHIQDITVQLIISLYALDRNFYRLFGELVIFPLIRLLDGVPTGRSSYP